MSSDTILSGSHREHPRRSVPAGSTSADENAAITLVLRRRTAAPEPATPLTREDFTSAHGADPADLEAVEQFARTNGFEIQSVNKAARSVALSGKLNGLAAAFSANVELRSIYGKAFRTRSGHLTIPESLRDRVVAVLGFDQRPAVSTNHKVRPRASKSVSYNASDLAQIYKFPPATGAGQTIAIIELGGGYRDSDLTQAGVNAANVTAVSVDGGANAPTGDPDGPDGEVALDIEVAGAVAPGAQIAVYFCPNTDQGFLDAINAAIHDTERNPSVISISWGAAEDQWTNQSMDAFNAAFHDAALLGISVLAAAGDNGSSDGDSSGNHVDFPASSPWVLGCGGTSLIASNGAIQSETVWNDGTNGGATGGGVSSFFSKPAFQSHVSVPLRPVSGPRDLGRGVPDVAGVADPDTGYNVVVDGNAGVIGGTSAVAPLWAGLLAVCNEELGKNVGWVHNKLYGTVAQHKALNDIVTGTNGAFHATIGWDCCTGWGSPDGGALLAALRQ